MPEPDRPRTATLPTPVLVAATVLVVALAAWGWVATAPAPAPVDRQTDPPVPTDGPEPGGAEVGPGGAALTDFSPQEARRRLPTNLDVIWQVASRLTPGEPISFYLPPSRTWLQATCVGLGQVTVTLTAPAQRETHRLPCALDHTVWVEVPEFADGQMSVRFAVVEDGGEPPVPVTIAYQLVRR